MLYWLKILILPLQNARHHILGVLDFLDRSVAACHRPTARKEATASPASPVSTLLYQQAKALQEAVCCYQNLTHQLAKDLQEACGCYPTRLCLSLVADLEGQRCTVQRHLLKLLILEEFHARNPESGRVGGLNAPFAARFILQDDGSTGSMCASLGELRNMMEVIEPDLTQDKAIHLLNMHQDTIQTLFRDTNTRLHPRYVQTYQKMEDTLYNQNVASSVSNGSFACVRKVQHKHTHEVLAMKTFFKGGDRAQILYEIGILEVCDHPNILGLVEAFTVPNEDDDDTINIVMRPWAPFTLQEFLGSSDEKRRARCPWFQLGSPQSEMCIYRIMQQLADAVAYLHRLSIKHKDIKPDNILLHKPGSSPPHAIVADVGVSKVLVHNGSTKYTDCSYPYLAPEQVAEKDSSLRADVWQLGCCFAMLLAVSRAGKSGHERLRDSFWRSGEDCSCQIAGEHVHFMRTFRDICLPGSRTDRVACSLVASMLNPVHETRVGIEGVLASVGDLLQQASKDGVDDVARID